MLSVQESTSFNSGTQLSGQRPNFSPPFQTTFLLTYPSPTTSRARRVLTVSSVDEMMPAATSLPLYFRKFGKKDVQTYNDTPHSWAFDKLGSNFWEVLMSEPGRVEAFSRGLSLFQDYHPIIGIFPFEELLQPNNSSE